MMDKIERIKELTKELNQYRHEYYNLNRPSVSDKVYDELFDKLNQLEKETGFKFSNSPTRTVGYTAVGKLAKVEHPIPLKSLDKTKSIDELIKWINNKEIILMLKGDGLTEELLYDNGKLIQSSTRGNSIIGEDTTHNTLVFKNIPLSISFKGKLRLVGEAVIHWNDFNEINSKLSEKEKYATPRNLVAGSVRQLNSKICAERNVYFYAFNILECSEELSDSKYENFRWLEKLGFTVIPDILITKKVLLQLKPTLTLLIDELKKVAENMLIPIDGMVGSFNSVSYSNSLSETTHHPLHSIAYKFFDETEEAILRSVEWNTTRSGQINPTACFDTIILDNTEVSRASLFNLNFIRDMKLNIGSRVLVSKRNLIIPYIEENLDKNNGELSIPEYCPSCSHKTYIENTGTADFLFCKNSNCPAQIHDRFVNFVKRDAMNIEGLATSTLEKFIDLGFIKVFGDIYRLEQYKSKIINLEGMGIKSYNKLIESINKSRNAKLENFIAALGIEGVGLSTAKLITKKFKTIENFLNAKNADLLNIDGIGDITAEAICAYRIESLDIILDLIKEVNFIQEKKKETNSKVDLTGKIFVITGDVHTFKNRKELQEKIELLNGKCSGSVSNKTSYLINNDIASTSGKNKTAKELGIKIITEDEFLDMIK
jgi:DNA ligase (NAD+)